MLENLIILTFFGLAYSSLGPIMFFNGVKQWPRGLFDALLGTLSTAIGGILLIISAATIVIHYL